MLTDGPTCSPIAAESRMVPSQPTVYFQSVLSSTGVAAAMSAMNIRSVTKRGLLKKAIMADECRRL